MNKTLLSLMCGLALPFHAQAAAPPAITFPATSNLSDHAFDPVTDKEINRTPYAVLIDGNRFVGNAIGINVDSVTYVRKSADRYPLVIRDINGKGDSVVVSQDPQQQPVVINGQEYTGLWFLQLKNAKDVRLLSLPQIREKYFPDLQGPCLFMIDRFVITGNVENYKVDENFLYRLSVVPSADISSLQGGPQFSVVRIETRRTANIPPVRIR